MFLLWYLPRWFRIKIMGFRKGGTRESQLGRIIAAALLEISLPAIF